MNKIIGIYKVVSPSNKIYIGQSIDVYERWKQYSRLPEKAQPKLNNSLRKYGILNHTFEVIEECSVEELNNREGYWQDFYESVDKGLNCKRTTTSDRSGYLSEETKLKISESRKANPDVNAKRKGVPLTEEHKEKISKGNTGKRRTEEEKKKIGEARKGKMCGKDHFFFGKTISEATRKIFSEYGKSRVGLDRYQSKEVIDLQTGIYYYSIDEASFYNKSANRNNLTGKCYNKTSLVIAEEYEKDKIKKERIIKANKKNSTAIRDGETEYPSIIAYVKATGVKRYKAAEKLKNGELTKCENYNYQNNTSTEV